MREVFEEIRFRLELGFGVVLATLVIAVAVYAQESVPDASPLAGIGGAIGGIIVGMIPAIIAAAKGLIGRLPPRIIPWVAVVLGVAGDAIWAFSTGGALSPGVGAALGLAAVGLRELYDQTKKAATKQP